MKNKELPIEKYNSINLKSKQYIFLEYLRNKFNFKTNREVIEYLVDFYLENKKINNKNEKKIN